MAALSIYFGDYSWL